MISKPFRTTHDKLDDLRFNFNQRQTIFVLVPQPDSELRCALTVRLSHLVCVCVCVLQNASDFSFAKNDAGEILTEDGRSRCPFNPEYKSTAIMAGRFESLPFTAELC